MSLRVLRRRARRDRAATPRRRARGIACFPSAHHAPRSPSRPAIDAEHLDTELVLGDMGTDCMSPERRSPTTRRRRLAHQVELAGVLDPRHLAPAARRRASRGRTRARPSAAGARRLRRTLRCPCVTSRRSGLSRSVTRSVATSRVRRSVRIRAVAPQTVSSASSKKYTAMSRRKPSQRSSRYERGIEQLRERDLEHPHDLAPGSGASSGGPAEEADERRDREPRRDRADAVEPGHDLDRAGVEADLLAAPRAAPPPAGRRRRRDRTCRPGTRSRPGATTSSRAA